MDPTPSVELDAAGRPSCVPTEMLARRLTFSQVSDELVAGTNSAPEKLRVIVRARPLGSSENPSDLTLTENAVAVRTVKTNTQGRDSVEECSFFFDVVYKGTSSQEQVFDGAMLPQVQALFAGRDTLTFAYGITNAGKTYTIQGKGGADELGCIPRALESTFSALRHHAARRAAKDGEGEEPEPLTGPAATFELDDSCTYEVKASFLEVYGNDAFDLLAPPETTKAAFPGGPAPKRAVLRLKEDRGQVFVEGLKEVELPDLESAVRAVQLGWAQRASASNGLNVESSRSHAVLCVKLLTHKPGVEKPTTARLCVVDLAGAERQKKTKTDGARLNEAMSINKDLMVLGHCLRDLRYNQLHSKGTQKVPPFRDSRITMLFRDYLSGNGQISVIAAISPRLEDAVGTIDTLKFASIAQQVKVVDHVRLPPSQRGGPVNLPRVAGGMGHRDLPMRPGFGNKPEPVREESYGVDEALEAEAEQLREQVTALQERLLASEAERLSLERTIREEVAAEMKEHLENTEAEMVQRLEMERYNTEELYHKKLALVKGATVDRANAASVAAHTEILQQTRDNQRKEAEHAAHVRRLEQELEQKRVELEAAQPSSGGEEELASARAAATAAQNQLAEEREARAQADEALRVAVIAAKESASQLESAHFQLATEREAKASLQKDVAELQGRCASLVELSRAPKRLSKAEKKENAKANKHAKAASTVVSHAEEVGAAAPSEAPLATVAETRSPKRQLGDVTNALEERESGRESPKRSRFSMSRKSVNSQADAEQQAVLVGVDGKVPKPSMLKQMRAKGLFGSKNKEKAHMSMTEDTTSGVYLDLGPPPSMPPPSLPEPTPISRRTRAGMERKAAMA